MCQSPKASRALYHMRSSRFPPRSKRSAARNSPRRPKRTCTTAAAYAPLKNPTCQPNQPVSFWTCGLTIPHTREQNATPIVVSIVRIGKDASRKPPEKQNPRCIEVILRQPRWLGFLSTHQRKAGTLQKTTAWRNCVYIYYRDNYYDIVPIRAKQVELKRRMNPALALRPDFFCLFPCLST